MLFPLDSVEGSFRHLLRMALYNFHPGARECSVTGKSVTLYTMGLPLVSD